MNYNNCIITDTNNKVLNTGCNVIKYLKQIKSEPAYYTEGKLEKGDIAVIAYKRRKPAAKEEYETIIAAYKVEGDGVFPVIKHADTLESEDKEYIDTIFERKSINVKESDGHIVFNVNDFRLSYNIKDSYEILILFNDSELKYFTPVDDEEKFNIKDFIKKGKYEPYCNQEKLYNLTIDELLCNEIMQSFYDEENFVIYNNQAVYITKKIITVKNSEYKIFSIESEKELKENLRNDNLSYDNYIEKALSLQGKIDYNSFKLWGNSPDIALIEKLLKRGSASNVTILLTGESGTGKTFLAKKIHGASKRAGKAFVHVNCGAIPYNLIESELFGYEEGSFTGANKGGKQGLIDIAAGGTLFLDEIAEIPYALQSKLLEVMQSKTFYRVGGRKKYTADVRFIAATNRNLTELVKEKTFREDLYYRINVFPIEIPPLRKRKDALRLIVSDLLPEICERVEVEPVLVDSNALKKIIDYSWPGNIRELENVLEKAAILCDDGIILPKDLILPEAEGSLEYSDSHLKTLKEIREESEIKAIKEALSASEGNKEKAAKILGIGRSAMFEKLRKYSIYMEKDN